MIEGFMNCRCQMGFTLLELIAVLIITGILAVSASVRFTTSDVDLQNAKSDLLAALIFARETAMARSDGSASIVVTTTSNSVDVRLNNSSISSTYEAYPLNLPSGVSISNGTGSLSFSALGEANAHSFTLTQGGFTETITVSGVGYAY